PWRSSSEVRVGRSIPRSGAAPIVRCADAGLALKVRAMVPWSAKARSVCSGMVLMTPQFPSAPGWLPSRSPRGLSGFTWHGKRGRQGWASAEGVPVRWNLWHEAAAGAAVYTDPPQRRGWPSLDGLRSGSPMAETPAAAPAGVAVSGHDVLLATKLHLPRPRPGFVPRPRLVSRLDEGLDRGLVLVCAPAGYGKSGALAARARRSGRPVAWRAVDAGDSAPVRFWRSVVAAVGPARPGGAGRLLPLFGPPPPSSFDGPVTALINELAAQPGDGEAVLILDDYHL